MKIYSTYETSVRKISNGVSVPYIGLLDSSYHKCNKVDFKCQIYQMSFKEKSRDSCRQRSGGAVISARKQVRPPPRRSCYWHLVFGRFTWTFYLMQKDFHAFSDPFNDDSLKNRAILFVLCLRNALWEKSSWKLLEKSSKIVGQWLRVYNNHITKSENAISSRFLLYKPRVFWSDRRYPSTTRSLASASAEKRKKSGSWTRRVTLKHI